MRIEFLELPMRSALRAGLFTAAALAMHVGEGRADCNPDILDQLRVRHTVLLKSADATDPNKFANGVLISDDGLILTVSSFLYEYDPASGKTPLETMWGKFRNKALQVSVASEVDPDDPDKVRSFLVNGDIVDFDTWRDLLLVKIPANKLEGMEPVPLSGSYREEDRDLCYAAFRHNSGKTEGRGIVTIPGQPDRGYWRSLEEPTSVDPEEQGAGIFAVPKEGIKGSPSLFGILTTSHFGNNSPGMLTMQYADTLLTRLMYSPMNEVAASRQTIDALKNQVDQVKMKLYKWQADVDVTTITSKEGHLDENSFIDLKFHHDQLDPDVEIVKAEATYNICAVVGETETPQRVTLSKNKHDEFGGQLGDRELELSLNDAVRELQNLQDLKVVDALRVKITTTFRFDHTRTDTSTEPYDFPLREGATQCVD